MKKTILLVVFIATIFSCGTTKTVRESKKVIKGNWTLTNVNYDAAGKYNITLLNDVSKECFEGSEWRFIPNNNTGIYTIINDSCFVGERNFVFTILEIDPVSDLYDFLLKPTDQKNKSVDNVGYRLRLSELSESTMTWEQTLNVEGKPFKIYMNFTKNIE